MEKCFLLQRINDSGEFELKGRIGKNSDRDIMIFKGDIALTTNWRNQKIVRFQNYNENKRKIYVLGPFIEAFYADNSYITDVSALKNIKELHLYHNKYITDVSSLGNTDTLVLLETGVTDLSALGGVKKLYLRSSLITDVSALGSATYLNLEYCSSLTDVTALGSVNNLILSSTSVTDVSALGGVDTLDLRYTSVTDVSALRNVKITGVYKD